MNQESGHVTVCHLAVEFDDIREVHVQLLFFILRADQLSYFWSNSDFGARAVYAALAKTGSTAVSECACEAQTEGNHGGGRRQRGGLCQEAAEGP